MRNVAAFAILILPCLCVGQTNQTILFTVPGGDKFMGSSFPVYPTTNVSGFSVAVTVDPMSASTACTVLPGPPYTVYLNEVGKCSLIATQDGGTAANGTVYNPATVKAPDFNVTPAPTKQTIAFTPIENHALGDPPFQVNPTTDALGLMVSVAVDPASKACTVSQTPPYTVTLVAVGPCQLTATQGGGAPTGGMTYSAAPPMSQTFYVSPASQTITFPNPGDKTIGTDPFAVTPTTTASGLPVTVASNIPNVCAVSQMPAPNTITLLAAGTCSLTAAQPGGTSPAGVTYSAATAVTDTFKVNAQYPGVDVVLGIGSLVTGNRTNYIVNSTPNVLQGTQIGRSSPQLLAGVSFQLPFNFRGGKTVAKEQNIGNPLDTTSTTRINANKWHDAYRPLHAFVSLKFSTGSDQNLVGYTFGITYRLQKYLDFLVGYAQTPFQEPAPGFRAAASYVVASNPNLYPTFNAPKMNNNGAGAFDGFPLQCITGALNCGANPPMAGAAAGTLLYTGNALEQHYRGGLIIGISVPMSLNNLFNIPKAPQ